MINIIKLFSLFNRYESPLHADRAVSQNGTFLNSNNLIGVTKLNQKIAKHMNLYLSNDGFLRIDSKDTFDTSSEGFSLNGLHHRKPQLETSQNSTEREDHIHISKLDRYMDDELYLKPYKKKNICQQIIEYFFSY